MLNIVNSVGVWQIDIALAANYNRCIVSEINATAPAEKRKMPKTLPVVAVLNFIALYFVGAISNINYAFIRDSFTYKTENWLFVLSLAFTLAVIYFLKKRPKGKIVVMFVAIAMIIVSVVGITDAQKLNQNFQSSSEQSIISYADPEFQNALQQLYVAYFILGAANLVALISLVRNK